MNEHNLNKRGCGCRAGDTGSTEPTRRRARPAASPRRALGIEEPQREPRRRQALPPIGAQRRTCRARTRREALPPLGVEEAQRRRARQREVLPPLGVEEAQRRRDSAARREVLVPLGVEDAMRREAERQRKYRAGELLPPIRCTSAEADIYAMTVGPITFLPSPLAPFPGPIFFEGSAVEIPAEVNKCNLAKRYVEAKRAADDLYRRMSRQLDRGGSAYLRDLERLEELTDRRNEAARDLQQYLGNEPIQFAAFLCAPTLELQEQEGGERSAQERFNRFCGLENIDIADLNALEEFLRQDLFGQHPLPYERARNNGGWTLRAAMPESGGDPNSLRIGIYLCNLLKGSGQNAIESLDELKHALQRMLVAIGAYDNPNLNRDAGEWEEVDGKWGGRSRAAWAKYLDYDFDLKNKAIAHARNAGVNTLTTPAEGSGFAPFDATTARRLREPTQPWRGRGTEPAPEGGNTGLVQEYEQDVLDNTNREPERYQPVSTPWLTERLRTGWQQHTELDCDCQLPVVDENFRSGGPRHYNKYDRVFIAAVAYWLGPSGYNKPDLYNCDCICKLAKLMLAIAFEESEVGYLSGYNNLITDEDRRRNPGMWPEGQKWRDETQNTTNPGSKGKYWVDTEDPMQVGNPRDGALSADKRREMNRLLPPQNQLPEIPESLTNYSCDGEQSIFFGVGWFLRKLAMDRWSCEDDALRGATERYHEAGEPTYPERVFDDLFKTGRYKGHHVWD